MSGNKIRMVDLQGHTQEPLAHCFFCVYQWQKYGIDTAEVEKRLGIDKGRFQPENILPMTAEDRARIASSKKVTRMMHPDEFET